MKRACVIGWPIAHSRSPLIHGYWLKKYGIDGSYTKEAVRPEDAEDFLRNLGRHGFVGCNVTVPHKELAFKIADWRHASAERIGAVNTLWLKDGKLCGMNTDQTGFMTHFVSSAHDWQSDGPVAILGAGGAAKAIAAGFTIPLLFKAAETNARQEIRVFNRTRERAEALALSSNGLITAHDWSDRIEGTRDAKVVVNTTTLGMAKGEQLDFDVAQLPRDAIVADIVYVPLETDLLRRARARGLQTVDGLGMLLHQAVPGFEQWFGVKPDVTPELRALIEADIEAPPSKANA